MQLPITLMRSIQYFALFALIMAFNACAPSQENNTETSDVTTTKIEGLGYDETEAQFAKLEVNEPFESVKLEGETVVIDNPASASTFTFESGAKINVPASVFVDAEGNEVTAPVTLVFREFHTASEIITSGIPMTLKGKDGNTEWLQTAGMFEIKGYQENEPVFIAEGKDIQIDLVSRVGGDYDTWFFNEETGIWENTGTSTNPEVTENPLLASLDREIEQLEAATATPPAKNFGEEEDNLIFNDLDVTACPELEGKKTIVLNYAGTDEAKAPKNNSWISDKGIWLKKELKPTGQKGIYKLTLMGDKYYSIPVRMGLQGAELTAAKAKYEKAVAAHYKRIADIGKKRAFRENIAETTNAFLRTMRINSMGIHNYDILMKQEETIPLFADFLFEGYNDEMKDAVTVFLVTGEGRTVVQLPKYAWSRFRFNPKMDNCLLAVLPGNQVATFSQADFDDQKQELINAKGSNYTFNMTMQDRAIENEEDLRGLLDEVSD